jgi:hypothetical protein
MTDRTTAQIQFLVTLAGMIMMAAAVGMMPTVWAAL